MLTQIVEGKVHLEDPDAFIELLFEAGINQGPGIFTRNCFVLVQGTYTDDATFVVHTMGMPLPESRLNSLKALSDGVDFFSENGFREDQVKL